MGTVLQISVLSIGIYQLKDQRKREAAEHKEYLIMPGHPSSNLSSKADMLCSTLKRAIYLAVHSHLHFMFKCFIAHIKREEQSLAATPFVRPYLKLSLILYCKRDAKNNVHSESVFQFYFKIWFFKAIFSLVCKYLFHEFIQKQHFWPSRKK